MTLVPTSWAIKESSSFFGVPESMIKKVKKLKSEKGILAEPNKKLGKKNSEDSEVYFRLLSVWWIFLMLYREKGICISNYWWCKMP